MKKLILILTLLSSSFAFANYYPNMSHRLNWQYSATNCYAYTTCPNGRVISCQVYGMNYGNVPSYMSNQCRSAVVHGRFVQCVGYVQQWNRFQGYFWAQANIPVRCF